MTVFQKAKRNCFSNRGNDNTFPTGKAKRFIQCCIVNAFKACPGMSGSIDVYRLNEMQTCQFATPMVISDFLGSFHFSIYCINYSFIID